MAVADGWAGADSRVFCDPMVAAAGVSCGVDLSATNSCGTVRSGTGLRFEVVEARSTRLIPWQFGVEPIRNRRHGRLETGAPPADLAGSELQLL